MKKLYVTSVSIKAGKKLNEGINRVKSEFNFVGEVCFVGKVGDFLITIELKSDNDDNIMKSNKVCNELAIKNIVVDKDNINTKCLSIFENNHKFKGIKSHIIQNRHVANLINHIIVSAQLTEVMHKHFDNIPRGNSNTLIMRKIIVEYLSIDSLSTKKSVVIRVKKSKVLRVKNRSIRVSDMKSTINDSIINYSVAQEISRNEVN